MKEVELEIIKEVKEVNIEVSKAIKGDKGDTGEQGIQGIQGIQGEKGDPGQDATPYDDTEVRALIQANTDAIGDISDALDTINGEVI